MLDEGVVNQVKRLLATGRHSQRKIARMTGVSRGSVTAIALGRRPDYRAIRSKPAEQDAPPFSGPPQRCPTCGGLVLMPCALCRTRKLLAEGKLRRTFNRRDGRLQLELEDEERARYEEVRATHVLPEFDLDLKEEAARYEDGEQNLSPSREDAKP